MAGVRVRINTNKWKKQAEGAARDRDARIERITHANLRNMQRQTNLAYKKEHNVMRDAARNRALKNKLSLRDKRFTARENEKQRNWSKSNVLDQRAYDERREEMKRKQSLWDKSQERQQTLSDKANDREFLREEKEKDRKRAQQAELRQLKGRLYMQGDLSAEEMKQIGIDAYGNLDLGSLPAKPKKPHYQTGSYKDEYGNDQIYFYDPENPDDLKRLQL